MTGNTKQATPVRMVHEAKRWTLELEELVPVTRSIFRPLVYNIEGQESILNWLNTSGHEVLASQAEQIFRQPIEADTTKVLEPHNQNWVQVHRPSDSKQKGEVDSIQIERLEHRLRSVERRLLKLQDLESQVAKLTSLSKRVMANPPAQTTQEAPIGQGKQPNPLFEGSQPFIEDQPEQEDPSEPDPQARVEPMETEEETAHLAPEISLRFPKIEAIEKICVSLIGNSPAFAVVPSKHKTSIKKLDNGYYFSKLTDENGNIVGLMLADTIATVKLGGGLMMIPDDVLAQEIEQDRPSDEEVDAMTEIFNNICPLINKEAQNPHVTCSEVQRFSLKKYPWIEKCSTWQEAHSETSGQLIMVSG